MNEFPFGYVKNKQGQDSHAIADWKHIDGKPDDLAHKSDIDQAIEDLKATDLPVSSQVLSNPFAGTVYMMRINHVWYVRGSISSYPNSNGAQAICSLPFSTNLLTFPALTDNSQTVTIAIFGSTLKLVNAAGKGGSIRFIWSIPEALL